MTDLYEQGRVAFLLAGPDAICPYQKHTKEYIEWSYGLMEAATSDDLMPEGHPV